MNSDRKSRSSNKSKDSSSKPHNKDKEASNGSRTSKHRSTSKVSKSSVDSHNEDYDSLKRKKKTSKNASAKTSTSKSRSPTKGVTKHKTPIDVEDMNNQGLATLSIALFQKTFLRELHLSGNNLRGLPTSMRDLVNLELLDVSKNPLKVKDNDDVNCFPIEMRLLKNLKILNISECNLRYIPSPVWLITSLEVLDISRNKIGLLVPDIGNLVNLKLVSLSQCDLNTLPPEIGFCDNLKEILLWGNSIEALPETLKECKSLEHVRISFRNFHILLDAYMENLIKEGQIKSEHIPVVIFELSHLKTLDLNSTKINHFPENNLKSLEDINLNNNYFDKMPDNLFQGSLTNLKVLQISYNAISIVPYDLKNLVNLEILDLSNNYLSRFPYFTDLKLPNLKELYLQNNEITELSKDISLLENLKRLAVDNNKITSLPDTIYELTQLEYLDISYNKIETLSHKITSLTNLTRAHEYQGFNKSGLWLIGNPLKLPPQEIWKTNSIQKIFAFLTTNYYRSVNYVFFAKLVFLGESGSGKSCIVDCLINPVNIKKIINNSLAIRNANLESNMLFQAVQATEISEQSRERKINTMISTPMDQAKNSSDFRNGQLIDCTPLSNRNSTYLLQGEERSPTDYMTRIIRKFFIRTADRVDFGIFDFGGDPSYIPMYPLFLSSIDHPHQPTIFVIVFSYSDYSAAQHDKLIGVWLKQIIIHSYTNAHRSLKVKLVGIKSTDQFQNEANAESSEYHDAEDGKRRKEILDNCAHTINLHRIQLTKEKNRLEALVPKMDENDENLQFIQKSIKKIQKELNKKIEILTEITLIELENLKTEIKNLMQHLLDEAKTFNKKVPHELRDQMKKFVLKHDKEKFKISLQTILDRIEENKKRIFPNFHPVKGKEKEWTYQSLTLSSELVLDYLVCIGDIFWLKRQKSYHDSIYHRFGFLVQCLQLLVRHDLEIRLDFSKSPIFKQIGLYSNAKNFNQDAKLAKNNGYFAFKILEGLWFYQNYSSQEKKTV